MGPSPQENTALGRPWAVGTEIKAQGGQREPVWIQTRDGPTGGPDGEDWTGPWCILFLSDWKFVKEKSNFMLFSMSFHV